MVYIMGIDNPDSGTVTSLDVLSVVPGIKNPKIFDPPQPCHQSPQQPPNVSLWYKWFIYTMHMYTDLSGYNSSLC